MFIPMALGSFSSTYTRDISRNYKEPLLASVSDYHDSTLSKKLCRSLALGLGLLSVLIVITSFFMVSRAQSIVYSWAVKLANILPMAFLFHFCAGGFSGALAKTVSAPIERVKLLIQTQDSIPSIASGKVQRYTGIINCAVRVYRNQGFLSFWRGNVPNVLRYFPVAAFNFAFKDAIEGCFPRYDAKTEFLKLLLVNLASGGLAGAGSLTIVYPLDYARTRLAGDIGKDSNTRQFSGLGDCLIKTIRSQGFFSLYSGYTVSVIGIIMYRAPYFGLFDTFNSLNPYTASANHSWNAYVCDLVASFFLAQVTSAIAAFVSYPLDTVRRRLQMEADTPVDYRKYKNAWHCLYVIITTEGFGALYKGFVANLFRGMSTAFMLVLFQQIVGTA